MGLAMGGTLSLVTCASRLSYRDGHAGCVMSDGEWKSVEGATVAERAAVRFFKVLVVP